MSKGHKHVNISMFWYNIQTYQTWLQNAYILALSDQICDTFFHIYNVIKLYAIWQMIKQF